MENKNHFFCCCPLKDGLTYVARFVLILIASLILGDFLSDTSSRKYIFTSFSCALSIAAFFQQSTDGSQLRVIYFLLACYSVLYCVICRGLIRGIEEERKEKVLLWIGFTVVTIVLLLTGSLYEFISCWSNFDDLPTKPWMLVFATTFFLKALLLVYFTWGAILLWKSMNSRENQGAPV